ncbi:MAG: ATP-binding protein [Bacillota bacterium]|nr:ATP-binding protein [Bacillota bacterium]
MGDVLVDAALAAMAAGALAFAYVERRAARRRVAEAREQLASMREFVAGLAENDLALQKELVDANAELNRRVLQLASLFEVGKELMSIRRPDEVLDRIAVLAGRLVPSQGCAIRILSRDRSRLILKAHHGLTPEFIEKSGSVPVESSSLGQVVRLGKPLAGVDGAAGATTYFEDMGREGMTFALSVPLAVRGAVTGVLTVYTPSIHERTRDEIRFLTILAAYASAALENAELYADLGQANRELSALKEYNESIIESLTIGLAVVDRDLVITTWNSGIEAITGIPADQALGRRYFEVLPEHDEAGLGDVLREVLEEGETLETDEMRQHAPDGREYVISCRVCPLVSAPEGPVDEGDRDGRNRPDGQDSLDGRGGQDRRDAMAAAPSARGSVTGAIIVAEDVTVRVSLGERLRRAERMKVVGEFAAGIAHEINNPVGIISACAEHLADKIAKTIDSPNDYLKPLRAIEEEAARCSSIIKNLTVFSRHQEMHLRPTDVRRVVEETLYLIEQQATASGVRVELEPEPEPEPEPRPEPQPRPDGEGGRADDSRREGEASRQDARHGDERGDAQEASGDARRAGLPPVLADEAQLKQVFLNLAMNAIQAMPEGGVLGVRMGIDWRRRGRMAAEPGMGTGRCRRRGTRAAERSGGYVWVEFTDTGCGIPRENLSKIFAPFFTTRSTGIGLGLAVSHGIVEAHGGTISVESKEGEGSTFTVRLPAARL